MTAVCSLQTGPLAAVSFAAYRGGGGAMLGELLIVLVLASPVAGFWYEFARRRHAEQRADALRADAVRLLLDVQGRLDRADAEIREWHRRVPQSWALDPENEHLREAGRLVHVARATAAQGVTLLGG